MMSKTCTPTRDQVQIKRIPALNDIEVLHAHYVDHSFDRHAHRGYAFGVIEAGALGFYYRGANVVAPAGSINLVIPGEVHSGYPASPNGWQYRMLYLHPFSLLRVMDELGGETGIYPYFSAGVIHDDTLAGQLCRMHALLEQPGNSLLEEEYALDHFLKAIIIRHAVNPPIPQRSKHEPRAVALIKSFLEADYQNDISIEALCQLTGITRFHLVRVFSQSVGIPPHAYLRQVRLQRARELLAVGQSIASTAAATGFADQSHLTRWFKKVWGFTPGEYSNSVQYT